MPLEETDLFDTPSLEPTVEPQPQPEPQFDYGALSSKVDTLSNAVNSLLLRDQRPTQPEPPHQQTPVTQDQGWKARDFFTKDEATLLLTSQDPAAQLNRMFNAVAESLYAPMQEQLKQRDQMLLGVYQEQQRRFSEADAQRAAEANRSQFFKAHPDMQEFEDLIPLEAQLMAQDSQTNPSLYVNKSSAQIYQMLSDRVRNRVASLRGSEPAPAPSATTPRTTMERGSGARVGAQAQSKDPNKQELAKMAQHLRR